MRLRRRHAWGAVLIALFVLPIWRPEGFPGLERIPGSLYGALAEAPIANPRLWRGQSDDPTEASPRLMALEEENARVWERVALLRDQLKAFADLRAGLAEAELDRQPLARSVVVLRGADPASFRQSLLVDRGADDGLTEGLAVTDGRVFVGRLKALHGGTALVQMVTDPHSRLEVAVRTEKGERARGYLRGTSRGRGASSLEVRFARVAPDKDRILPGAPVLTSNADLRIPAGLLVGFVESAGDPDGDGMPILEIRPALDPDRLVDLFVLVPR
jgi:rod shape-determining protein MreC